MLEPEELAELESTLLPALERHQLRLLAHGLRTLQTIAGRRDGPCPEPAAVERWCGSQAVIAEDPGFARAFLERMESTAAQLAAIAAGRSRAPLALTLADLAQWACEQADDRLAASISPPPPPSADPPPG